MENVTLTVNRKEPQTTEEPTFALLVLTLFTHHIWAYAPRWLHFTCSRIMRLFCEMSLSRFIIPLYCRFEYDPSYDLQRFIPPRHTSQYLSFQDFFMRKLRHTLCLGLVACWPCDGLVCEASEMSDDKVVYVKGEPKQIRDVFGAAGKDIPNGYYFTNIFLHNRDYHRIHAPIGGEITRIEHIPGKLFVLRPWAYRESPSFPALTNERINVDILSSTGETWYLSIVGGPGVSTIKLDPSTRIGRKVQSGQELAAFEIGSTCCIASPMRSNARNGHITITGQPYS